MVAKLPKLRLTNSYIVSWIDIRNSTKKKPTEFRLHSPLSNVIAFQMRHAS